MAISAPANHQSTQLTLPIVGAPSLDRITMQYKARHIVDEHAVVPVHFTFDYHGKVLKLPLIITMIGDDESEAYSVHRISTKMIYDYYADEKFPAFRYDWLKGKDDLFVQGEYVATYDLRTRKGETILTYFN